MVTFDEPHAHIQQADQLDLIGECLAPTKQKAALNVGRLHQLNGCRLLRCESI
jgi:hypothetical protein